MQPQNQKQNKKAPSSPKASAFAMLARREYSRLELITALVNKGFEEEEAQSTVGELAAENWQSDARYVQAFVNDKVRSGNGPLKIAHQLAQKGIENFEPLLEEVPDWFACALSVLERRYSFAELEDCTSRDKAMRYLYQRGFPTEMVRQVMRDYLGK